MLRAVVDETEPLHENAREQIDGAVLDATLDACVHIERIDERVERLDERHVAVVVEAAQLLRAGKQLVTDDHARSYVGVSPS